MQFLGEIFLFFLALFYSAQTSTTIFPFIFPLSISLHAFEISANGKIFATSGERLCSSKKSKNRIEKHRKQREKFGFKTVEFREDFLENEEIWRNDFCRAGVVLVENIGNLAERIHFGAKKRSADESAKIVLDFAKKICETCKNAVFVSNEICLEQISQNPVIFEYCSILSHANNFLAKIAGESFFVAAGIKILLK